LASGTEQEFLAGAPKSTNPDFRAARAVALQQLVGIGIPLAVRIVVAENGGSRLRFLDDTHRVIGFDQTRERFFDLVGVGYFSTTMRKREMAARYSLRSM
jgi:hypothetical protein